jgi:hypothetical protein
MQHRTHAVHFLMIIGNGSEGFNPKLKKKFSLGKSVHTRCSKAKSYTTHEIKNAVPRSFIADMSSWIRINQPLLVVLTIMQH